MEQGATGINSSVPTASLTGRIWFFLLLLRTTTYSPFGKADRLLASIPPLQEVPASDRAFTRAKIRRTDGYEPRATSAHFVSMNSATEPSVAWLAARGGGANLARPSEAWSPTPPARPLGLQLQGLRAKVLLSPRIRGIRRAACVPRAPADSRLAQRGSKPRIVQHFRDRGRFVVRRAQVVPVPRVLPAPGNTAITRK